jgi:hypothetical protein
MGVEKKSEDDFLLPILLDFLQGVKADDFDVIFEEINFPFILPDDVRKVILN